MTAPALALVVPLFDEEVRLAEYGKLLVEFIAARPSGSELVFVDDGSTDSTCARVEELIAASGDLAVRLLRRPHEGKGAALAAGLATTRAPYAGFCDLDLSTPLDHFEKVVDAAVSAPVLAIGSRDLKASTVLQRESRLREALGRTYNRLLQATVTPGIVDTQCGAKVAARGVWERVLPHCRQRGFAWDAELVAVALALGIGVREVPIEWRHDDRSKIRVGRDGVAMVLETRRIWSSARRAATGPASSIAPADGVFEGQHADELIDADRTHWWFRGKAALVATALARTGGARGFLADVGAGAGGVTAMLGWDVDRVAVLEAGQTLVHHARHGNGMPAVRAAVAPVPLADASVDVICLLDVIEHLPDPSAALTEAARVLRGDGRLVVNVPAHAWLWSSADVHLGHHRRYDRRMLRRQLAAAGFEPVLLSHVFAWLVPPVWVERRWRRRDTPALGLDRSGFVVDRTAMVLTTAERLLLGRVSVPVGTSLLCVARPTRPSSPRGTPLPR
ncbi:MAG TPA: glycosyltransferase [Acidimicrobiales bacterium]|nr:glycosyltransferase [Acidimicrobiales bacterium]